ncbi:MAG: nucleotidyltransferase family protein [Cyclobacteriaceae bacterium]
MRHLNEIKSRLAKQKERLIQEYPIKSIGIFGSFARGQQTQESDVDIMVEVSGDIGIRFIDLADELESIVGIRVDVVSKNGIKEKYLKSINSEIIYV